MAQGLPGSPAAARERVVSTLAVGGSDRVDGCEVEDVEAEVGDLRESAFDVAQRAGSFGVARAGAREQLVPGAKSRPHGIADHLERTVRRCGRASVGAGIHEPRELGITGRRHPHRLCEIASQDRRNFQQPPGLLVVRTPPYAVSGFSRTVPPRARQSSLPRSTRFRRPDRHRLSRRAQRATIRTDRSTLPSCIRIRRSASL